MRHRKHKNNTIENEYMLSNNDVHRVSKNVDVYKDMYGYIFIFIKGSCLRRTYVCRW